MLSRRVVGTSSRHHTKLTTDATPSVMAVRPVRDSPVTRTDDHVRFPLLPAPTSRISQHRAASTDCAGQSPGLIVDFGFDTGAQEDYAPFPPAFLPTCFPSHLLSFPPAFRVQPRIDLPRTDLSVGVKSIPKELCE